MHTERESKLFVGMLPKTVDDAMLESLFAPYGKIKEVHIIRTPEVRKEGRREGGEGRRMKCIRIDSMWETEKAWQKCISEILKFLAPPTETLIPSLPPSSF
jgi:hypothetical protein